jgi:hypothetical protein
MARQGPQTFAHALFRAAQYAAFGLGLCAIVSYLMDVRAPWQSGTKTVEVSTATVLISVIFCAFVATLILFGYIWHLNVDSSRKTDRRPPSESPFGTTTPEASRPFSERLAHFVGDDSRPDDRARPQSRMQFFLAFVPGRRYGPKSVAYLREVLARIQRVLHGHS